MKKTAKFNIKKEIITLFFCVMILTGCSQKSGEKTGSEGTEISVGDITKAEDGSEATEAASETLSSETYPETLASAEGVGSEGERDYFGIMHAIINRVVKEDDGSTIYTFTDKLDPENVWAVRSIEFGDILVEASAGTETAVMFLGDIINNSEDTIFVAMLPEGDYTIGYAAGVMIDNAMSTFTLDTGNGETLSFLKDNCPMDEGVLSANDGDRIVVYYAEDTEGNRYPFRIYASD